jgi:hypothetical protein
MQLKANRPFLGSVEGLVDVGEVLEAADDRAKELISLGLVSAYSPVVEDKSADPVTENRTAVRKPRK